jgi:23S rRNA (cytosine1962-C5)-methyltransferase
MWKRTTTFGGQLPKTMDANGIWWPEGWTEHELLDSGGGRRLERFGDKVLDRPETGAVWPASGHWKADHRYEPTGKTSGKWTPAIPGSWRLHYAPLDLHFALEATRYKHIGVFPEQAANWEVLAATLRPGDRFLNLFAYTGGASLAARRVGAEVTHVDTIRQVVDWTRKNMEISGLEGIRWVVDDAAKFVSREARRGNLYSAVMLDPPTWGIGPKGTKWRLEDALEPLLRDVHAIVEPGGLIILNTYSGLSPATLHTWISRLMPGVSVEVGELCLRSADDTFMPTGSCARIRKP